MSFNFYHGVVMHLIGQYPGFQNVVTSTCPTRWVDGSVCPPADDTLNKAFMEVELLMELDLI